ncbi:hypothetical protein [Streptomyces sp. NBC_00091]|uniref:hypothetical protein n=1 Tax=Streptomyces sp. NBC_00091 TaxID=2975648 RepID=UPI00225836CB|nr:hypothetical protein [Streptomyces sp. NBC_00091]MCX5375051.1 hypothetical protein [Streptomyces sp. NBC_00091]
MAEAVPVRCPSCRHENGYTVPVYPCACGSPVAPPLDLAAPPVPLTHRNWSDAWVTVRCGACGRESEWPHPEVGCASCGLVVRVSVHPPGPPGPAAGAGSGTDTAADMGAGARDGVRADVGEDLRADLRDGAREGVREDPPRADPAAGAPAAPGQTAGPGGTARPPLPRPAFRPVTIRTARDAVVTAALYLRWLGFQDVRQPDGVPVPSAAVDLRAPGVVAQVDPTTAPAGLRAVECVWLNGLTASATSVYFSLAGYTEEARGRADELGIPLFVMDLTGMPQPVNDPADELVGKGA